MQVTETSCQNKSVQSGRMKKLYSAIRLLAVMIAVWGVVQSAMMEYNHTIYVSGMNPNAADNSSCWDGNIPCRTLNYALQGVHRNSTQVIVEEGEYELLSAITIQWISDLSISGSKTTNEMMRRHNGMVLVSCVHKAGLSFFHSRNIVVENITFSGCGVIHNSTSRNFTDMSSFSFLEFQTGLYFLLCMDISFSHVTVSNTNGTGMVIYSTGGQNTFQYCDFSYNHVEFGSYSGGGGIQIEFPFCIPGDIHCEYEVSVIPPEFTSNAKYVFSNSLFGFNEANMTHPIEYTLLVPQRTNHLGLGHGGGLSMYFSRVKNSSLILDNCTFSENIAPWGAGVFVEFQEMSWNNTFLMESSLITMNECYNYRLKTGGGGMRLGYSFLTDQFSGYNQIKLFNSTFIGNRAYWGGGVSFFTARESNRSEATNMIEFTNCTWASNSGNVGSAIDLSVWYSQSEGSTVKTHFTNCSFAHNNDKYGPPVGKMVGMGTLYTDSVPVIFKNGVKFKNNSCSAVVVAEASVDFLYNCMANFTGNTGRNGGAISLFGSAYIRVHNLTKLYFVSNLASQYGGAIYSYAVGKHGLLSFGNCFIQHEDITLQPWNWTSEFYFENNTARNALGGNNSISAVSLLPCLWGSDSPTQSVSAKDIFCWGDKWKYVGRNCEDDVSSAPAYFNQSTTRQYVEVIPGKPTHMHLQVFDDRGNDATSRMVLTAWSRTNGTSLSGGYLYISDNNIELYGPPDSTAEIIAETIDPRVVNINITARLLPCPPGFFSSGDGLTQCTCGGAYRGRVQCKGGEFTTYLQRGQWMGYSHKDPEVVVGMCAYTSSVMKEQYVLVPNDSSLLDSHLCAPTHRTGVLCGSCVPGYGPAVNSRYFDCVRCHEDQAKYHWVFYILSEFLPSTIFFFVVVIFQISVTQGPANAFVFFAQVITTTFDIDGDGMIPLHNITSASDTLETLYTIPYDIWNLNFFQDLFQGYCLSPHIDTLGIIALRYLVAVYPLLLIFIFYVFVTLYDRGVVPIVCLCRPLHRCFANLRRRWNLQHSIVDAFATFLVLSYTKLTVVSVYLITPVPLFDNQGNTVRKVMYYNGNVNFLSKEHVPYFVLAIVVLFIFVLIPPLLLLSYPLKVIEKISSCIGHCHFQIGGRLQMFLDTFQGCYKDGTNGAKDCRYFAGLYFVLRTVLFTTYAYTGIWFRQYTVQQIVCTITILLFAIIRPYKNNFYNNLDAMIFGILAAINTLSIYNTFLTSLDLPLPPLPFAVQYILIFCPLIYMIGYISWLFWSAYKHKILPHVQETIMKALNIFCCPVQIQDATRFIHR